MTISIWMVLPFKLRLFFSTIVWQKKVGFFSGIVLEYDDQALVIGERKIEPHCFFVLAKVSVDNGMCGD
ncbi:hypothetical protein MJD09_22480 [bacterium]|nr:hypothetical protein [bacterium]